MAYRFHWIGPLIKGRERLLIKDGEVVREGMHASYLGENDLLEALRSTASVTSPEKVKLARLERSGNISVIGKKGNPRILEVEVEDGVQLVRIRLE